MVRYRSLPEAVRKALAAWPGSARELAARAGIPQMTLSKIRRGRLGASEQVARHLLVALTEAAADVTMAGKAIARELERTVDSHGEED